MIDLVGELGAHISKSETMGQVKAHLGRNNRCLLIRHLDELGVGRRAPRAVGAASRQVRRRRDVVLNLDERRIDQNEELGSENRWISAGSSCPGILADFSVLPRLNLPTFLALSLKRYRDAKKWCVYEVGRVNGSSRQLQFWSYGSVIVHVKTRSPGSRWTPSWSGRSDVVSDRKS